MGRSTSGVQGMRLRAGDEVIAIEIARDDMELLVVTENGFGKRTRIADYPVKGRGGLGVKTIQLVEARGRLIGARAVRDGYQVMLISTTGTMIKIPVEDVRRMGRSTQGVIVMRLRGEEERVSGLAPVVEPEEDAEDELLSAGMEPGGEDLTDEDSSDAEPVGEEPVGEDLTDADSSDEDPSGAEPGAEPADEEPSDEEPAG